MKNNNFVKGAIFTAIGACCWGFSGNIGQYLSLEKGFEMEWIVVFRLVIVGLGIIFYYTARMGKKAFDIFKSKQNILDVVLFACIGMMPAQYTFFLAIKYSNAGTATVLQYTGPVIIMIYLAIRNRKMPSKIELLAIVFALGGTFLLATQGNIHSLSISSQALFWGIISAFCLAFYTLLPQRLLMQYDSTYVIGWGMFIGGIILSIWYPITEFKGTIDAASISALAFICIMGTLISFSCYLLGVKYIGATLASLFASLEPLSATIVSVVWMKAKFTTIDFIGFGLIIATVFILSFDSIRKPLIEVTPEECSK